MEKQEILKKAFDEAGNNMAVAALGREEAVYVMRLIMKNIAEHEHAKVTDDEITEYILQHLKEEDRALSDYFVDAKLYRF